MNRLPCIKDNNKYHVLVKNGPTEFIVLTISKEDVFGKVDDRIKHNGEYSKVLATFTNLYCKHSTLEHKTLGEIQTLLN
jgi:hypothetical protein